MIRLFVHAYLSTWVLHRTVGQNVLAAQNVHKIRLVLNKNVLTLVLDHVVQTLIVKLSTTAQYVLASFRLPVIHLPSAHLSNVSTQFREDNKFVHCSY